MLLAALDSTIVACSYADGKLTPGQVLKTAPSGGVRNYPAEVLVSGDGKNVYLSNRGHDSIVVFRVGDGGKLTFVEYESTRGRTPRNFAIDPTGRWLIAANERSDTLAVFSIDPSSGALTPVGPLASVGAPVSVLFMD